MASITAALVKELRDKTGAGMMDCKKALEETTGDLEVAVDWLRTKGLASAAKKAGRAASEGLIGMVIKENTGALVEINAETDFVARNDKFQCFVSNVAEIALTTGDNLNVLKTSHLPGNPRTVDEELTQLIATIGENMNIRRAVNVSVTNGILASYIHNRIAPGLGKIGVLVGIESDGDTDSLSSLGKQIAMHIAAAKPLAISQSKLNLAEVERETVILREQARETGKSEEIINKMVEGRLKKFYEEVCLLDQTYVIDGESKVADILANAGKEIGAPVSVRDFAIMVLGEGIEKKEEDFAAEVAAAAEA